MRRGKITNISLIFIVIVAFFTVMSYLFDQLVINSEDKLRNTKVLYENKKNELVANITFAETLSTISKGIDINIGQYLLKRNFFIKSLILFDRDKRNKNIFSEIEEKGEDIESYIKWQMQKEFVDLTILIQDIERNYNSIYIYKEDIIKDINKDKNLNLELFSLPKPNEDEKNNLQHEIDLYDNLLGLGSLKGTKTVNDYRNKSVHEFSLSNWLDVYKYKMLLLKKLDDDQSILDEFISIIDEKTISLQTKVDETSLLTQDLNIRKNYFILFSIFSQVLSLLFLLLLFRSFLLRK